MLSRTSFVSRYLKSSGKNVVKYSTASHLTERAPSPNQGLLDMLERSKEEELQNPDYNKYKVRSYNTAINSIAKVDYRIRSAEEAGELKGVGAGLTTRIAMYLNVGDDPSKHNVVLKELVDRTRVKNRLTKFPGLGANLATKLYNNGCRTVEDLRQPKYLDMIPPSVRMNVEFEDHLAKPVTRDEFERVTTFMRDSISSEFEVIPVGAYRRDEEGSDRIEVIVLHPSYIHIPTPAALRPLMTETSPLANDIVWPLRDRGLIVNDLVSNSRRWVGIVRIPEYIEGTTTWEPRMERMERVENRQGAYKRLEIFMVPAKSKGAALLALTGDDIFNASLRSKAADVGLHLNEFGLWRWVVHEKSATAPTETVEIPSWDEEVPPAEEQGTGHWELIESEDERQIFHELGKRFVQPEKRNLRFVTPRTRGRPRQRFLPPEALMGMGQLSIRGDTTKAADNGGKRPRGRPRKVVELVVEPAVTEPPKKRGRPRKITELESS